VATFNQALVLVLALATLSCQNAPKVSEVLPSPDGTYVLELKPESGRAEKTQYHSRAVNRIFKGEILRKKEGEDLDFLVQTQIEKLGPAADEFTLRVKTLQKAGPGDLRDFAMPEIGEDLRLRLTSRAEVREAGSYARESLFFLPTISLPKEPVKIGDSWVLLANWVTFKQRIPLKMELVTIFKEIRDCDGEPCALFELSGEVKLNDSAPTELGLQSQIQGFLLFSLKTTSVVWSHVRSDQVFFVVDVKNNYRSCFMSYVTEPARPNLSSKVNPFCDPEGEVGLKDVP
jgi:hypothetical protein